MDPDTVCDWLAVGMLATMLGLFALATVGAGIIMYRELFGV